MRTRARAVLGVGMALAIAAVGAAYAWDRARADTIADGVRVAGVELGGLDERSARALLRRELIAPLARPVTVTYAGNHYTLDAADLDVRANVDAIVAEALTVSREGSLPARIARYASGGEVDHTIDADVTYSRAAIDRFIANVAARINAEPRDASVLPTTAGLETVAGREGRAVREDDLRQRIKRVIAAGGPGPRTIEAPVEAIEPSVRAADLAAQYPTYVTIDRASFTLRLYRHLELAEEYTVAIGQQGYETPTGVYAVQSKQVNPTWYVPDSEWAGELAGTTVPPGPENPLKARWMGFNGGAGIHGTADTGSLGSAASHGCVRMAVPDVIELYGEVGVGTPVYIG